MNGWVSVAIVVLAQIAAAAFLMHNAARGWFDYLAISVLTVALSLPTEHFVTGDVSRYLPNAIWSDGGDGKDQIIYASVASTVLLPLIVSAIAVYLLRQACRALQSTRGRSTR
jgi:hypothetical protein